jgi:hypothetical protein
VEVDKRDLVLRPRTNHGASGICKLSYGFASLTVEGRRTVFGSATSTILHMHYAVWFDKNLVSYVDNFDRARFSILLDNTLVRCTFDPKRLDNGILGKALSELTQSDLDDMLEHVIGYLSTFTEELIQGRVASLPDLLADNVNYKFSMQEAYDDCRAIVSDGRSCPSNKANRRRTFLAYENMVRVPCRVDRLPQFM